MFSGGTERDKGQKTVEPFKVIVIIIKKPVICRFSLSDQWYAITLKMCKLIFDDVGNQCNE